MTTEHTCKAIICPNQTTAALKREETPLLAFSHNEHLCVTYSKL